MVSLELIQAVVQGAFWLGIASGAGGGLAIGLIAGLLVKR